MYTYEIINLINSQQGKLTKEQYNQIYDYSPQLKTVFYDEKIGYKYQLIFDDKVEPVLFNLI